MTQEQVAERAGLTFNSISRYELGYVRPSQLALNMLSTIYEKPVDWLMGEPDELEAREESRDILDPQIDHGLAEETATYQSDMAFVESLKELSFGGEFSDLTPEQARLIRIFAEFIRAEGLGMNQERNQSATDEGSSPG